VDEAGQAEPAQVVGHLTGAVVAAEQPGDQDAEVLRRCPSPVMGLLSTTRVTGADAATAKRTSTGSR
jgi:hypothetical protein